MKIVIEIPKKTYIEIKERTIVTCGEIFAKNLVRRIRNGTPLPEHHGRLIDADRLTRPEIMHLWYHLPNGDIACPKVDIDNAPTIIEGSESE